MRSNRALTRRYRSVNQGEVAMPICVVNSEGNDLIDAEGKRYLDFSSGSGVTNAGWQPDRVFEAVRRQLDKLPYCAPWFPTDESIDLSELLLEIGPPHLSRVVRALGGTDANEAIARAAYCQTGRSGSLVLSRAYHGGARLTAQLSDAEAFHLPVVRERSDVRRVPAPYCYRCPLGLKRESCGVACADLVNDALSENSEIGLFLCEPIIGSGGVIIPPREYLTRVQEYCRAHEVLFVLDEVITGFGRAGWMTVSEGWDLQPDAIALGKGISGGTVPIGAALVTKEVSDALSRFEDVSPTFAWTPIACAAAAANIRLIVDEGLPERAQKTGAKLLERTRALFERFLPHKLGEVRGIGMMVGIELVQDSDSREPDISLMRRLVIGLVRGGLMVKVSWDFRVIIFMPPLNLSGADLERAMGILETQLARLSQL